MLHVADYSQMQKRAKRRERLTHPVGPVILFGMSEMPPQPDRPDSVSDAGSSSPRYEVVLPDGQVFGPATQAMLAQWAREGRIPRNAKIVNLATQDSRSATDIPAIAAILNATPSFTSEGSGSETVATVIPYRNPPALVGYYLAVFSIFPFIGLPLGLTAIVLGIIGLRRIKANPESKGTAHAWIAIVLGAVGVAISVTCITGMILMSLGP
jgi:hypothetical protein